MLSEIIASIGFNNILDEITNSSHREYSIYAKINIAKDENVYLVVDKTIKNRKKIMNPLSEEDYDLFKWFSKRENLSLWMNNNKAIDASIPYKRKIISNNMNVVIFKYANFKNVFKKNTSMHIKNAISKYLENLNAIDRKEYFFTALEYILENFPEEELLKRKIKLFIDEELSKYFFLNKIYLENALANKITDKNLEYYLEKTNTIIYSGFSVSGKKHLLKNIGMPISELGIVTRETAFEQELLKRFLECKNETRLVIGNFEIIKNFKEKAIIEDFRYIDSSCIDLFESKNLSIIYNKNIKEVVEKTIKSRLEFKNYLYSFLADRVNIYSSLIDRLLTNKSIKKFIKKLKEIYINVEHSSKNDYFKMNKAICFEISCEDYFKNKNLSMEFEYMYEKFSEKLSKHEDMKFNSLKEISYVLGQLARYVRNNSKNKSNFNFLKSYLYNYTTDYVLLLVNTDLKRFKTNKRTLRILYYIIDYIQLCNIKKVDELSFKKGLFDINNIFYVKGKINI